MTLDHWLKAACDGSGCRGTDGCFACQVRARFEEDRARYKKVLRKLNRVGRQHDNLLNENARLVRNSRAALAALLDGEQDVSEAHEVQAPLEHVFHDSDGHCDLCRPPQ